MSEAEEYKQYLIDSGQNPEEVNQYLQYLAESGEIQLEPARDPYEDDGSVLSGTKAIPDPEGVNPIDMAMRTADMPGGLVRTGYRGLMNVPRALAKALEAAGVENEYAKKPNLVTADDFKRALTGQAPTMSEFQARDGATPGTANTITGLTGDIALDPLTYSTFGMSGLAKLYDKLGRKSYKTGLKELDIQAAKYGKEPVSDLLMERGVVGSSEQIQKQIDELAAQYLDQRNSILLEAGRKGAEVDMNRAMGPLMEKIAEIRKSKDPALQGIADIMEADAKKYLDLGAKEGEQFIRELPQGRKITPAQTQLETIRGEGGVEKLKRVLGDKFEEVGSLPTQGDYVGPYRSLPTSSGKKLPLGGNLSPLDTDLAEKFRVWKKLKQDPDAILPGKAPYVEDEILMGQVVPEASQYKKIPSIEGQQKLRTTGTTYPEKISSQPPLTVLDEGVVAPWGATVDRIMGPAPKQTSGWKSSTYDVIGDKAYDVVTGSGTGKGLLKKKAFGLNEATIDAVNDTLGKLPAEDVRYVQEQLGKLLSTKERARMDAIKEMRKLWATPVDSAMSVLSPKALAMKKIADALRLTEVQTRGGRALMNRGKKDLLLEKNLLYTPWLQMNREYRDEMSGRD